MKQIHESLFILEKSYNSIHKTKEYLIKILDNSEKSDIRFIQSPLLFFIMLEVSNFKEEYDNNFGLNTEPEYLPTINKIKDINKPIFKYLNKRWKHLFNRDFRNQIIAHPWRDKQNKFITPDNPIYKIPRTIDDYIVLYNLIKLTYAVVNWYFVNEIFDAVKIVYHPEFDGKLQEPYNIENLSIDLQKLQTEINAKTDLYSEDKIKVIIPEQLS